MASDDEKKRQLSDAPGSVLPFHQSRVAPARTQNARDLGLSVLARQLGLRTDQLTGHWCSHCVGIWYGTALEAECPSCGSRRG